MDGFPYTSYGWISWYIHGDGLMIRDSECMYAYSVILVTALQESPFQFSFFSVFIWVTLTHIIVIRSHRQYFWFWFWCQWCLWQTWGMVTLAHIIVIRSHRGGIFLHSLQHPVSSGVIWYSLNQIDRRYLCSFAIYTSRSDFFRFAELKIATVMELDLSNR